jgi:hypothetical protein
VFLAQAKFAADSARAEPGVAGSLDDYMNFGKWPAFEGAPGWPLQSRERTMLRITVHEVPRSLTFQLEGGLAGPWLQELEE